MQAQGAASGWQPLFVGVQRFMPLRF